MHKHRRVIAAAILVVLLTVTSYAQNTTDELFVEFFGAVQSANDSAIVINGQIIDVTSVQSAVPLAVGAVVRVQASWLADGSLIARSIEAVPVGLLPGIVEITGVVSNISPNLLVIGSQSFGLSIADIDDDVQVGETVRVIARAASPSMWLALDVDHLDDDDLRAPVFTPEVSGSSNATLPAPAQPPSAPVQTPEVGSNIPAPVQTSEVGDDRGGDNRDNRGGDDNDDSGHGSDDSGSGGSNDDNSGSGSDDSSGND